jgi:hypothetical protein
MTQRDWCLMRHIVAELKLAGTLTTTTAASLVDVIALSR